MAKLNRSFSSWVSQQLEEDPLCDLSEGTTDYVKYASDLKARKGADSQGSGGGSSPVSSAALTGSLMAASAPQPLLTGAGGSTSGSLFSQALSTGTSASINSKLGIGVAAEAPAPAPAPAAAEAVAEATEQDFLGEGDALALELRAKMYKWRDELGEDGQKVGEGWGNLGVGKLRLVTKGADGPGRVLFSTAVGSTEKFLVNGALLPGMEPSRLDAKNILVMVMVNEKVIKDDSTEMKAVTRRCSIKVKTEVEANTLLKALQGAVPKAD